MRMHLHLRERGAKGDRGRRAGGCAALIGPQPLGGASTMRRAFRVALSHEYVDAMRGKIRNLFTVIGKLQRSARDPVS